MWSASRRRSRSSGSGFTFRSWCLCCTHLPLWITGGYLGPPCPCVQKGTKPNHKTLGPQWHYHASVCISQNPGCEGTYRSFSQWWQTPWWLDNDPMATAPVPHMGRDSGDNACWLLHTGVGIVSGCSSRDGRVKKIGQICVVVSCLSCSADSTRNSGPNQRIGCGIFEYFGPQNRGNLFRRQKGTILVSTTLDRFAAFQCNFAAWVVCEWRRPEPLAIQLFCFRFC